MQLDPRVTQKKYERELDRLIDQRPALERKGVFLLGPSDYPVLDFLYVPRHPLKVSVPTVSPSRIILPQGTVLMMQADLPSLAMRAFKARFDLTDYDLRPPSVEFLDPWSDQPLDFATMFRALEFEEQRKAHVVLLGDHPVTHKPFLCLRGIREYHEHPQHSGDDWLLYRNEMSLFSLVISLWRVGVDLVHPQLVLQPPNPPQVVFTAEEKL